MAYVESVTQSGIGQRDVIPCQPLTVSYLHVENSIVANGISADIRRYGWNYSVDSHYEAPAYYLDYSLGPRASGARFFPGGRDIGPPGDVVFIPKGATFDSHCDPSEHRLLCLTFENPTAARIFESGGFPSSLPPCFDVRSPWVHHGLARLAEEVRNPGFAQDILLETIALSLVVDLCRHLQVRQKADDSLNARMADWRLNRLKGRIKSGLAGPLSIADLASECGLSSRHLMRTFKNTAGVTISHYIADARIAHAKRELVQDGALIKVIAGNCGFQSAAAFSAAFRKATGLSPRRFRDQMR